MLNLDELSKSSLGDVLLWHNAKVSAVCLSCSVLSWYLLFLGSTNFLTPVSRLANIFFLFGALHRFGYMENFSEKNLLSVQELVQSKARNVVRKMYPIFTWETPGNSLIALGICFTLSIISAFMSFSTSILFVLLCAFSIPIAYQKNKKVIDSHVSQLNDQVLALTRSKLRKTRHVDPASKSLNADTMKEKFDRVDNAFFETKDALLNKEKAFHHGDEPGEGQKEK